MNQVKKLALFDPESAFFPFLLADWDLVPSVKKKT